MAFPTTGVLDDFTRADLGANWSSGQQLAGITFVDNHFGQSPPTGWPG